MKKKMIINYSRSAAMGFFSKRLGGLWDFFSKRLGGGGGGAMGFFPRDSGGGMRVRNSRCERAISVQATVGLLYILFCKTYPIKTV